MTGIGTIVNVATITAGSLLGFFIRGGLPKKYKDTIMHALSLAVLMIGISGTLQGLYTITSENTLDRQYIITMIVSLAVGALIGEKIDIEKKLEHFGLYIQKKVGRVGNIAEGFVTASLVFCIGAMAIVGALNDGLSHDPEILFAKATLDGIAAIIFTSTLGLGVLFSIIPVLIYQGGITLVAGFVEPVLTDLIISQISLVGNVLIFAIGLNILGIKKIKVGNMLPAIFMPIPIQFFLNVILPKINEFVNTIIMQ